MSTTKSAILAGGCFWCTEAAFEQLKGVLDVTSGYAGGSAATANYRAVCGGDTGHAEAIRITYDPAKVSYDQLLDVFFDAHDPTQLNRQGNDIGTLTPVKHRLKRAEAGRIAAQLWLNLRSTAASHAVCSINLVVCT